MDEDLAAREWGRFYCEWNGTGFQHVVPLDDIKEHVMESNTCWCKPERTDWWGENWWGLKILYGIMWTHNSLDGREQVQQDG